MSEDILVVRQQNAWINLDFPPYQTLPKCMCVKSLLDICTPTFASYTVHPTNTFICGVIIIPLD